MKLLNFKPSYVKVNEKELKETNQVRVETMFPWNHLAKMVSSFKISLLNIRSWNCHIAHFLAESIQFDVLQRQLMMSQTLEMLTVLEMIENCFSNLLVMTLPFNIKPLRFPFITHSDTTSFIQSRWYTYVNSFDISITRKDQNIYCWLDGSIALTSS